MTTDSFTRMTELQQFTCCYGFLKVCIGFFIRKQISCNQSKFPLRKEIISWLIKSCRTDLTATPLISRSSIRMAWHDPTEMPTSSQSSLKVNLLCTLTWLQLNYFNISTSERLLWMFITFNWYLSFWLFGNFCHEKKIKFKWKYANCTTYLGIITLSRYLDHVIMLLRCVWKVIGLVSQFISISNKLHGFPFWLIPIESNALPYFLHHTSMHCWTDSSGIPLSYVITALLMTSRTGSLDDPLEFEEKREKKITHSKISLFEYARYSAHPALLLFIHLQIFSDNLFAIIWTVN